MEDAINTIVLVSCKVITRDIENNKSRELFEFHDFFHIRYQIIAKIEFHECLQAIKSIKLLDLIVLHRKLCETFQLIESIYPSNSIPT